MASNETPTLRLNTWNDSDYFKRVEINENFTKIDNAVESLEMNLAENKKRVSWVSVLEYENLKVSTVDGFDWTPAFQEAADVAKAQDLGVLIPYGDFLVKGSVTFYTGVTCYGRILALNSTTVVPITFASSQTDIILDSNSLTNLDKYSVNIPQIQNQRGATLILSSNEALINRDGGSVGETYNKREVSFVTSNQGDIQPPLYNTYTDKSKLTAKIKPKEKTIQVTGLNIISLGDSGGRVQLLSVRRSNIDFYGLVIRNESITLQADYGVYLGDVVNVNFYGARVTGFLNSTLGYGFSISNSALISFYQCHVHDCKHAISGRHGKSVRIIGGSYSNQIDSHWGNDFIIDGACVRGGVLYAGSDITLRNMTVYDATIVLGIRTDTPELSGKIVMDNIQVVNKGNAANYVQLLAFSSATSSFDFGKVVKNPDFVSINNIVIDVPSDKIIYPVYYVTGRNYQQTMWGKIEVSNIKAINGNRIQLSLNKNSDYYIQGSNTEVKVSDIDFAGSDTLISIYTRDDASTFDGTKGFSFYVDRCKNINFRVDDTALVRAEFTNSHVRRIERISSKTNRIGDYLFKDCELDNTYFKADRAFFEFKLCKFRGAITHFSTSTFSNIDAQTKLSYGNVSEIGTTGYPPLDNKKDANFYI
jgi:hypothetical protein